MLDSIDSSTFQNMNLLDFFDSTIFQNMNLLDFIDSSTFQNINVLDFIFTLIFYQGILNVIILPFIFYDLPNLVVLLSEHSFIINFRSTEYSLYSYTEYIPGYSREVLSGF